MPSSTPNSFPYAEVKLSAERKTELLRWLRDELDSADAEQVEMLENVKKWERQYKGSPKVKRKTFPFDGAANITVNLTAMTSDAIVARTVRTIEAYPALFVAKALSAMTAPLAKPLERFLDYQVKRVVSDYREELPGFHSSLRDIAFATTKFGYCPWKICWDPLRRKAFTYDENFQAVEDVHVVREGPVSSMIRHENFTLPSDAVSVGSAQWVREAVRLRFGQIQSRAAAGHYKLDAVAQLKDWQKKFPHPNLQEREIMSGISTGYGRDLELDIIQFRAPLTEDGEEVEQRLVLHRESMIPLRWTFNRYFPQWRDILLPTYFPVEGWPYGRGICEMTEQYQAALSTIMNQGIDNGTIANTRMFKARKGSGIRPGQMIYPGKVWLLDDVKDLEDFPLGEVHGSIFQLGLVMRDYAERATGVSDYNLGRESSVIGRRGTATTTLALIQESNRRFDFVTHDFREYVGEFGMRLLEMFQQFRPTGASYYALGDDGMLVQMMMQLPRGMLRELIGIEVAASTAAMNREVEKMNQQTLMGVAFQYYDRLFQLAMLLSNPQTPPALKEVGIRISVAAKAGFEKLLETFEQRDIAILSPDIRELFQNVGSFNGVGAEGESALSALGPPPGGGNGSGEQNVSLEQLMGGSPEGAGAMGGF
jgi:hypothetical protein